jgi:hypothetical protein
MKKYWTINEAVVVLMCAIMAANAGCMGCKSPVWTNQQAVGKTQPPKHDAYLTWREYSGIGDAGKAIYIFNGKDLGRGTEGLGRVIAELGRLPKGTVLLIYPVYPFPQEGLSGPNRMWPFLDRRNEFYDMVKARDIRLVFSEFDHKGAVVPMPTETDDSLYRPGFGADGAGL